MSALETLAAWACDTTVSLEEANKRAAVYNGVVELIEAAKDPNVSWRRLSGVVYADPYKGERARERLHKAITDFTGVQS